VQPRPRRRGAGMPTICAARAPGDVSPRRPGTSAEST
jgi:hypothetical protein